MLSALGTTTAHKADAEIISGQGYASGIGEGYYTHYSFINYCPLCNHYGTLDTYVKGVNEITCLNCDADYSYSGRDKYEGYTRAWLTSYSELEAVTQGNQTTQPVQLSHLELAHQVFSNNSII